MYVGFVCGLRQAALRSRFSHAESVAFYALYRTAHLQTPKLGLVGRYVRDIPMFVPDRVPVTTIKNNRSPIRPALHSIYWSIRDRYEPTSFDVTNDCAF